MRQTVEEERKHIDDTLTDDEAVWHKRVSRIGLVLGWNDYIGDKIRPPPMTRN